jgi:hypothetical protein
LIHNKLDLELLEEGERGSIEVSNAEEVAELVSVVLN